MIVLDANILIRGVLGVRVMHLLQKYSTRGVEFYAPETCFVEAERHLVALLLAKNRTDADANNSLKFMRATVRAVQRREYASYEEESRTRLRRRDESDWPILACALSFDCPVWTEDRDFFGIGVATWTSDLVEMFLKSQGESFPASKP